MNRLKVLICGLMLVCVGFTFVGCGDKEKSFDADKVVFGQNQFTYDGNAHIFDITYDGVKISALYSLDGETFTDKDELAIIDVGTYKVYFKITAEGYGEYVGNHTMEITSATLDATKLGFTTTEFVYDGTKKTFDVTYEGVSDITVLYSVDEGTEKSYVTKENLNLVDVGTYTVYYSVTAPNYGTYYGQKEVTISSSTLDEAKLGFTTTEFVYDGTKKAFDVTYEGISDITVMYSVDEGTEKSYVTKENLNLVDVGTYTVYYSVTAPNYDTYYGQKEVTISSATFDASNVRTGSGTMTWDGTNQIFNVYYGQKSDITVKYSTDNKATWVSQADFPVLAPSETAYVVYFQISAPNYNTYEGSLDVKVSKANIGKGSFNFVNQTATYNGQAQMFTMQYKGSVAGVSDNDFEYWYAIKDEDGDYVEADWVQDPTQLGIKDCKIVSGNVSSYDIVVYAHDTKGRFNDYGRKIIGHGSADRFNVLTFTINKATITEDKVEITNATNVIYDGSNQQLPTITYTGEGGNTANITYNIDGGKYYYGKDQLTTLTVDKDYTIYYCIGGKNFEEYTGSVPFKINKRSISIKICDVYQVLGDNQITSYDYEVTEGTMVGNSKIGFAVPEYNSAVVGAYDITVNALYGHNVTVSAGGTYYVINPATKATEVLTAMQNINSKTYNNVALFGKETDYTLAQINEILGENAINDFYIEVGEARSLATQMICIDNFTYRNNSEIRYSIGNANFIVDKAFIVEDGKLKVSAVVLSILAENSTTLSDIVATSAGEGLELTVVTDGTGYTTLTYDVTVKNGTTMLMFKSTDTAFESTDVYFTKKTYKNSDGQVTSVGFGSSTMDGDASGYYTAIYPIGWKKAEDFETLDKTPYSIEYTVNVVGKGCFTVILNINFETTTVSE